MYSRIPVPYGNWDKKEMRYSIGLFPVVGAVIGVMTWLWLWGMHRIAAQGMTNLPEVVILLASTLIASILPVLVTGGIHVDGFMDTSDAFHSWADRGKKLQILSDPHIGAFSVISLMILAAVWVSAVTWKAACRDVQSRLPGLKSHLRYPLRHLPKTSYGGQSHSEEFCNDEMTK